MQPEEILLQEHNILFDELSILEGQLLNAQKEKQSLLQSYQTAGKVVPNLQEQIAHAEKIIEQNRHLINLRLKQKEESTSLEIRTYLQKYQADVIARFLLKRYIETKVVEPTLQVYQMIQLCYQILYQLSTQQQISKDDFNLMLSIYRSFPSTESHANILAEDNINFVTEIKTVINFGLQFILAYYSDKDSDISWIINLSKILQSRSVTIQNVYEWYGNIPELMIEKAEFAISLFQYTNKNLQEMSQDFENELIGKAGNKKRALLYLLESISILMEEKKILLENYLDNIMVRSLDEFKDQMTDISYIHDDLDAYQQL